MKNLDYILDCTQLEVLTHGAGTVVNLDDILNCSQKSRMRNMDYILDCTAGSTGHGASAVVNLNDILNCSKKKMQDAYLYPQLQENNPVPDDILNCITRDKAAFSHKDDILYCISYECANY